MAVTMKDLAKYTGFSLGTISNYINGKVTVSKEKGECIEKAIEKLGYTVNASARSLKMNSFECVGILIPSFSNQFMLRTIKHIEQMLAVYNYNMLVLSYNDDAQNLYKQLNYLKERTDGILCVPLPEMDLSYLKKSTIPIITFDEATREIVGDRVLVNNIQIVEEIINCVIKRGHHKIGFIAGRKQDYTTLQRRIGYENALTNNEMPIIEKYITYGTYEKKSGYECCKQLLKVNKELTAIFVVGYRMTLGVLAALKELHREKEVEVIGYDAGDIADITNASLGYVYQPYLEIARKLVELIIKRINGDYSGFPMTFIVKAEFRESNTWK